MCRPHRYRRYRLHSRAGWDAAMSITYEQALDCLSPAERVEMIRMADELRDKIKARRGNMKFSQDGALEVLFSIGKVYADEAKKQAARRAK